MTALEAIRWLDHVMLRPWVATPWVFQVIGGLWSLWLGLDVLAGCRVRNRPAVDGHTTWVQPGEHAEEFGRWCVLAGVGLAAVGIARAGLGAGALGWPAW